VIIRNFLIIVQLLATLAQDQISTQAQQITPMLMITQRVQELFCLKEVVDVVGLMLQSLQIV